MTSDFDILITWSEPQPEQGGRLLAEIAAEWNVDLLTAAQRLQPAGAVYHGMDEDDVKKNVLRHPATTIGSDGLPNDPLPHPRLWGAFPRVLGHYVREEKLFDLPTAIHKMTGLSAARFGLTERGLIRQGYCRSGAVRPRPRARYRHLYPTAASRRWHPRGVGQRPAERARQTTDGGPRWPLYPPWPCGHGMNPEENKMSDIIRIGTSGTGTGGQHLPFARAAGADGWLFVSGQTPMETAK